MIERKQQCEQFRREWEKYKDVPMAGMAIELISTVTGRKCRIKEGVEMSTLKESMDYVIEEEIKERVEERQRAAKESQKAKEAINTTVRILFSLFKKGQMSLDEVLKECKMSKPTFCRHVNRLNLSHFTDSD